MSRGNDWLTEQEAALLERVWLHAPDTGCFEVDAPCASCGGPVRVCLESSRRRAPKYLQAEVRRPFAERVFFAEPLLCDRCKGGLADA